MLAEFADCLLTTYANDFELAEVLKAVIAIQIMQKPLSEVARMLKILFG